MISIENYTTLNEEQTIKDAIQKLKASFTSKISTGRIMETGHRSLLVLDDVSKLKGVLTIKDLLKGIMPAYLSFPKPSTADSIQYSPMFWSGMFTREIKRMAERRIKEVMSPPPLTIEGESNLMEAAYIMIENMARRLIVVRSGEVAGVIREQDLFFEIERTFRD
jgi:CBS domain-containing protein